MSEIIPQRDGIASSLPSQSDNEQDLNLGDVSEKDKVWDKHKANADKVSEHYRSSFYKHYSNRINFCSELLDFKLVPDVGVGVLKLKLAGARFCRVRHCPVCQWRRSLMWKAKAHKILPKVVEHYPKHRWLFLTLTIRNVAITELRNALGQMHNAFVRLTKVKEFPAVGWIKSTEVTRGKTPPGSAHPHFHILLMVPPSYFSGKDYLSQKRWSELWQRALCLDYEPMVHIKAVAKHHNPQILIPEILKYQVKESDLVSDRDWFIELTKQLHKTRAVSVGGVLRDCFRALEEEPEDLIGKDETGVAVDEGHLYFEWKKLVKKYKLQQ